MNYLTFKLIIGDDPGAKYFQKIAQLWNSAKNLDESYFGPEFYWAFFQLGDFDMIDLTIVKWELWSTWRLKGNRDDFNKGAYIGATSGLFFYNPSNEESWNQLKTSMQVYFEKRRSKISPFLVIALKDATNIEIAEEQKEFVSKIGGKIIEMDENIFEGELQEWNKDIFTQILLKLEPEKCRSLKIEDNYWFLPLTELQAILMADRQGIRLRPRNAPPPPLKIELIQSIEETETQPKPIEIINEEVEDSDIRAEDLSKEELQKVAISPEGKVIPLTEDITREQIVELVKKGYTLPDWVVIPRHCPRCFNQNQRSIREIVDKSIILMQNPVIYGFKYICGNCGKEWH